MTKFDKMTVRGWRQFKSVEMQLHPRLTIITGANGAGKSTLLSLLSRHFGYNRPFLSTPVRGIKSGVLKYIMDLFRMVPMMQADDPNRKVIGRIEYANGAVSNLMVSEATGISYDISMTSAERIDGIHIDSHRPPAMYRHVGNIPATPATIQDLVSGFSSEMQNYYSNGGASQGSLFHLKSALINMAIYGYGNEATPRNEKLVSIYEGFQDKLREVLPISVGFRKFSIQSPEVIMETNSGNFVMDSSSGGVIKLIEVTWQLYSYSTLQGSFVATMDEPENHLHPSMQRTFLANLVRAFPQVQFVIVTHSPFIVSSVRDSNVYVLQYEDSPLEFEESLPDSENPRVESGPRVVSMLLDTVNKAGTAQEILRQALGVPTTLPDWAEDRLQAVVADYRSKPLTEELLKDMYAQLEAEGLVAEYPNAVQDLASAR